MLQINFSNLRIIFMKKLETKLLNIDNIIDKLTDSHNYHRIILK